MYWVIYEYLVSIRRPSPSASAWWPNHYKILHIKGIEGSSFLFTFIFSFTPRSAHSQVRFVHIKGVFFTAWESNIHIILNPQFSFVSLSFISPSKGSLYDKHVDKFTLYLLCVCVCVFFLIFYAQLRFEIMQDYTRRDRSFFSFGDLPPLAAFIFC